MLTGRSPESIVGTLVKEGYPLAAATAEVDAARTHPYIHAATPLIGPNADGGASATVLAKREWVLECERRCARLDPATATVPIVQRPSRDAFLQGFYGANRPVLIEGAMDDWPAMTGWTPEAFKRRLGGKMVEVQFGRERDANYEINSHAHKKVMPFGEYVDLVTNSGKTNDFYMTANNSGRNHDALADLWNDIRIFPEYLRTDDPANRGFFWYGPQGTVTPLHHDLTNNFMAQVIGRKRVRLIAPYDQRYIYNHRHCFSQVDVENVDYDRFPLFRNARVIDVMLNPGQVLFLPIGWWHHVVGVDISITMTFTNFVFDNDFSSFYTTYNTIG